MKKWVSISGYTGLLIALYGLVTAIVFSNVPWYSYFVIGGALFLGYLNYRFGNESILKTLEKNKIKVLKTYGLYLMAAILIELVGRFLLHLWEYPSFDITDKIIHVFLITYPFAFFFIYESFVMIRKKVKAFTTAVILTTLINAFLHEIPNTFAHEWVYRIPYITLEIFQINIVVIIGWVILVSVPIITKRILG